jgi:hypothetical protein
MRRGFVVIIVLAISSLACAFIGLLNQAPTNTPIAIPAHTQVPIEKTTSSPTSVKPTRTPYPTSDKPTKTPYPTSVLDSQLVSEIDLIQTQVVEERGLQPKHPVPVVLLSPDELRRNVVNDFLADYTDEKNTDDVHELSIIGLLDPGFDLRTLYINLYSEGIEGYYDNEIDEMFVVQGEGFQGPERLTYAHEFTHVLQDQNYDFKNGLNYNNDTCKADTERCAAIQALIEGDATLSEVIWYQNYATSQDKQQIDAFQNSLKLPVRDSAPAFLKEDFTFPYNQGFTFVMYVYRQGGDAAVDAVFLNPAVSTEQILHPNLYPSDTPIPVDLPDIASVLGEGWREVSRNQMGEWYTYLVLARGVDTNAQLVDATAAAAAAGWGGDEYLVLHNDATNATAFVMKTVWDNTNDAVEFNSAFQKYANIRFGINAANQGDTLTWSYQAGYTSLYLSGDTTIWITAPDVTTAQTISGQIQP